jgi:hypothetical protein
MTHLGGQQPVALFFGVKFLGVEEAAHPPETDVGDLNDPPRFQGDIQIIAETAATGADDGFVPDFHVIMHLSWFRRIHITINPWTCPEHNRGLLPGAPPVLLV